MITKVNDSSIRRIRLCFGCLNLMTLLVLTMARGMYEVSSESSKVSSIKPVVGIASMSDNIFAVPAVDLDEQRC